MQARCKCGNGVFIVMVEEEPSKYASTKPDLVTIRYECTLCDHKVFFEMDRDDAAAFCADLKDTYGTEEEDES